MRGEVRFLTITIRFSVEMTLPVSFRRRSEWLVAPGLLWVSTNWAVQISSWIQSVMVRWDTGTCDIVIHQLRRIFFRALRDGTITTPQNAQQLGACRGAPRAFIGPPPSGSSSSGQA